MNRARGRRAGRLVAVEGTDGVGKSTLARRLAALWRGRGVKVALLREPSDRGLGRRAVALAGREPFAAALLFTLDRALARHALERARARGDWVVLDRSYFSTLAYQGSALTLPARRALHDLQSIATQPPDAVVWLDLPVPDALRRLTRRGRQRTTLERRATLERVRRAYGTLARSSGSSRWIRVDARGKPAAVAREADRLLRAHGFAPGIRCARVRRS